MRPIYLTLLAIALQPCFGCEQVLSQELSSAKEVASMTERVVARGKNFIVYAYVQTELQDYLVGSSKRNNREDYKAYVLVDGQSMVNEEGLIDPSSLDWEKIATEMRKLRVDERSVATFHLIPGRGPSDFKAVQWLLEGFGRDRCRFDHVYWRFSTHNTDFWQRVEASQELASDSSSEPENGIGNELVRVFPVQTFLSRYNSDDADCVVRVIPQLIHQPQPEMRGAIQASMLKYVPMLELARKQKLLILVNYHEDAQDSIDWLRNTGASMLAEKLGFEEVTFHTAEYATFLKNDD